MRAMSVWSVKTRRAPSRHCRYARVYGHTTTATHDMSNPPSPLLPSPQHFVGFEVGRGGRACVVRRSLPETTRSIRPRSFTSVFFMQGGAARVGSILLTDLPLRVAPRRGGVNVGSILLADLPLRTPSCPWPRRSEGVSTRPSEGRSG